MNFLAVCIIFLGIISAGKNDILNLELEIASYEKNAISHQLTLDIPNIKIFF